jgi:PST family polysaccharide transporter
MDDGVAGAGASADLADGTGRPVMARASRALGWSLLNTAVSRLGTLGIGIALARMLGPAEFGTFAVATVALLAVLSFNELGVSLAIVRWPVDPAVIAPTVTTISLVTSAGIAVAGIAVAPSFATAMGAPEATVVVQVMMASVLINGLVATPAALLQRYFQQSRRMVIDQVNVWLGAVTSIVLAALGMGAMSLAIGRVAGSLASAVLFLAYSPLKYQLGLNRSLVPGLLRFGLPLAGASIVVFALGYADQVIAGRVLGPIELGYYVLAFNLASWPVTIFSQPMRSVAPALFSAIQHDRQHMRATLVSVVGVLAAVSIPCCLVMAGAAAPIVTLVYGTAWQPSSGPLFWLALFASFRILFELFYDYLVVLGRSVALLKVQIFGVVCVIPVMILGAHIAGIVGIAAAQLVTAVIVTTPAYLMELRRVGIRLAFLWRRLWLVAVCSMLAGSAVYSLARLLGENHVVAFLAAIVMLMASSVLVWRDRHEIARLRISERSPVPG